MFEGEEYSVFRNPLVTMPELAGGGGGSNEIVPLEYDVHEKLRIRSFLFYFGIDTVLM